ncbi:MAG: hypothetical protein AAF226_11130, partial [Verrucomicrobiota bacterium]
DLRRFVADVESPELVALATQLASETGVNLDPETLLAQAQNPDFNAEVRVASLNSLVDSKAKSAKGAVAGLLGDKDEAVAAAAMKHGFALAIPGIQEKGIKAVSGKSIAVARAAVAGLGATATDELAKMWTNRGKALRPALQLDAYLALQEQGHASATEFAATPNAVFNLSQHGGDSKAGAIVFQGQGACLQCHKVGKSGGIQGPDLTKVGVRLDRSKLVESIVNPGAEISPGYGMTVATLKSGNTASGLIKAEDADSVTIVALDGAETKLARSDIETMTPPISAMPPLGASLPPRDLRDLVAYLAAQKGKGKAKKDDAESHGDDEKIAK